MMPAFADSLRARLTWLAFAIALISVAMTIGLAITARSRLQEPDLSARVAREYLALQARELASATGKEGGDGAPGRMQGFGAWHVVSGAEARVPRDTERLPVYHALAEQISAQLPGAPEVRIGGLPQPQIWIALGQAGSASWAVVPLGQVTSQLPVQLLISLVVGALAIAALAALTAARITRPLTVLESAVEAVGSGATLAQLQLDIRGPREVRQLARRFAEVLAARDAAESARRVMLAGLPHDLRAPLTRLRARLELVGDEKVRAGLRSDAEDMRAVVDQFIEYVRGTDPSAYKLAPLDLVMLVGASCDRWRDSGFELLLDLPKGPVTLAADASMLGRLLDVLIDNAMRYGKGPIGLSVRVQAGKLELTVADHGPGIDPARRARAMEPFTRLDEARSGPGTGLGLALARAIAVGHAGELELSETPGGGLTAKVLLPSS